MFSYFAIILALQVLSRNKNERLRINQGITDIILEIDLDLDRINLEIDKAVLTCKVSDTLTSLNKTGNSLVTTSIFSFC